MYDDTRWRIWESKERQESLLNVRLPGTYGTVVRIPEEPIFPGQTDHSGQEFQVKDRDAFRRELERSARKDESDARERDKAIRAELVAAQRASWTQAAHNVAMEEGEAKCCSDFIDVRGEESCYASFIRVACCCFIK